MDSDIPDDDETGRLIRPYAMTRGRTVTNAEIPLESQLQATTRAVRENSKYRWEAARILALAERPMALVEIAARAEVPLGVARVVIADLIEDGVMMSHQSVTTNTTSYSSLLEKVLDGVRNL